MSVNNYKADEYDKMNTFTMSRYQKHDSLTSFLNINVVVVIPRLIPSTKLCVAEEVINRERWIKGTGQDGRRRNMRSWGGCASPGVHLLPILSEAIKSVYPICPAIPGFLSDRFKAKDPDCAMCKVFTAGRNAWGIEARGSKSYWPRKASIPNSQGVGRVKFASSSGKSDVFLP